MKTCTVCLKNKSEDKFYDNLEGKDGYFTMCKKCCAEYQRYRKEKARENKTPKPRQKIFYNSKIPLPPDPDHQIKIERGSVTLHFD